ncbi:hypothetical protein B0H11DRAFT_1909877 [Mycena galericulata]|nr:hypothetical protein B0H11DRAFT_1909877 [Mycena galericulata]
MYNRPKLETIGSDLIEQRPQHVEVQFNCEDFDQWLQASDSASSSSSPGPFTAAASATTSDSVFYLNIPGANDDLSGGLALGNDVPPESYDSFFKSLGILSHQGRFDNFGDLAVVSMDYLTPLESLDQDRGAPAQLLFDPPTSASPQNPSTAPALDSVPDWFCGKKDFQVLSPDMWGHDIPDVDWIAPVFPQSPSTAPALDPVSGIGGNLDWFLGQQGLSCPHVSGDDSDCNWITPLLPENPLSPPAPSYHWQQGKVHLAEGDTQHVSTTVRSPSLSRGTHTPKNRNSRVEVLYPKYQY